MSIKRKEKDNILLLMREMADSLAAIRDWMQGLTAEDGALTKLNSELVVLRSEITAIKEKLKEGVKWVSR